MVSMWNRRRKPWKVPPQWQTNAPLIPREMKAGLCAQADDPSPWLSPSSGNYAGWTMAPCRGCPVLQECQEWATEHRWVYVIVGGWYADGNPNHQLGAYPPWKNNADLLPRDPTDEDLDLEREREKARRAFNKKKKANA